MIAIAAIKIMSCMLKKSELNGIGRSRQRSGLQPGDVNASRVSGPLDDSIRNDRYNANGNEIGEVQVNHSLGRLLLRPDQSAFPVGVRFRYGFGFYHSSRFRLVKLDRLEQLKSILGVVIVIKLVSS